MEESAARGSKRELLRQTLSDDYPGLDYLGFHGVLHTKRQWYKFLWFAIVLVCFLVGLYTIFRILKEYVNVPSATLITVKSVEKLKLPQVTLCPDNPATLNLSLIEEELFRPNLDAYSEEDVKHFAFFVLMGSGFQKTDLFHFSPQRIKELDEMYLKFRGENTTRSFFYLFFNRYGLQCHEFFQFCKLGNHVLDCCKITVPTYTIRRGRCFRTKTLFQESFDELGKLRIQMKAPLQMDDRLPTNRQLISFVGEQKPEMAPFPRYYLYPNLWNKMRISAEEISLFPAEEICSEEPVSKATCYLEKWLLNSVEEPFNCTYPYMDEYRKVTLPTCEPFNFVMNYSLTVQGDNYLAHNCLLPCYRWEFSVSLERTDIKLIDPLADLTVLPYRFRIDVSYNDLQYTAITEVATTTFFGLLSQIGGQLSLFLGSSILNLVQSAIMIFILISRYFRRTLRRPVGPMEHPMPSLPPRYNHKEEKYGIRL
ncbi:hypothetical protein QR680_005533 [Steinernema hermaphroditum]|uniref:Uncharacterized protein n=1 Tax=Steinernema hermaphroditum TaxID=289476 RepID=A0AA39LVU3_9BILA|nr:hypothetical protein QR680_005533 [Steinernema hermaphroditum]